MYQAICTCRQTPIKGVLNQGQSPQRTPLLYAHMNRAICTCRQTLIKGVLNQGQSPQRTPLLYAHMYQAICTCRQTLIKGVLNQGQSPQRTPLLYAHMHVSSYMHVQANANQGCTEPGVEPPTYTLAICSHVCIKLYARAGKHQSRVY